MRKKLVFCLAMSVCILFPGYGQKVDIAITASSSLAASSTANFSPENVLDGGTACWSEGKAGSGIGEYIQVDFRYPDVLEYVMIKNGYGVEKYWESNSRIKTLKVSNEEEVSRYIHLEDTPDMKIYGLHRAFAEDGLTVIDEAFTGSSFKFVIMEVYPGTKWNDACITEIGINKWYYEELDLREGYIYQNLFREYLEGLACEDGKMYVESDWESFVEPMIEDGYYFSEISSGDGTEGFNEGQIFVNGMTGEYFILQSDYISELDYEHIDFNEELQDDPVRVDSYRWDVLRYDKKDQEFRSIKESVFELLFDVYPIKHLIDITGENVETQMIWIAPLEPGFIKVVFTGSEDEEKLQLDYYWDGNYFRLQE